MLLGDMHLARITPNRVAWNTVILACDSAQQWQQALHVLAEAVSVLGCLDHLICTSAMAACRTCGCWQLAVCILAQVQERGPKPDVVMYNAAISALSAAGPGAWQLGLHLLTDMCNCQMVPDVVSCASLLSLLQQEVSDSRLQDSLWQQALHLLQIMRAEWNVSPNLVAWNAVLASCGAAWQQSLRLLQEIPDNSLHPDAISFNTAILSCSSAGRWEWSLQLLQDMHLHQVSPSSVTCSAIISALASGQRLHMALQALSSLHFQDLRPNEVSYNAAIAACVS
eukprot:TRINITY_DN80188_c0_g1_i1.p1 TRINITY_DN80188_c0_g1~~TRINITY_DN80188_c0_g1_i1.p1  ORF type:complete len:290 (+),score=56.55 TRINITY_DN80188_c0_g1_i1:27-872(+)